MTHFEGRTNYQNTILLLKVTFNHGCNNTVHNVSELELHDKQICFYFNYTLLS